MKKKSKGMTFGQQIKQLNCNIKRLKQSTKRIKEPTGRTFMLIQLAQKQINKLRKEIKSNK